MNKSKFISKDGVIVRPYTFHHHENKIAHFLLPAFLCAHIYIERENERRLLIDFIFTNVSLKLQFLVFKTKACMPSQIDSLH